MKLSLLLLALTGFAAHAGNLGLSWDAAPKAEEVVKYTVYEQQAGTWTKLAEVTEPKATLPDVTPGVHTFAVTASNMWKESPRSTPLVTPPLAEQPTNLRIVSMVRFVPRPGLASRMKGGRFEGATANKKGPYVTLAAITKTPAEGWNELPLFPGLYRYLRYSGPLGSYGNVAEISFYSEGVKLKGTPFGTAGSFKDSGNTFEKAVDGDTTTYFDGPVPSNVSVGIEPK